MEKDSYLTYVIPYVMLEGEFLITEYVSVVGKRYGFLLSQELENLVYLPGLCDIMAGELMFDDGSGNLRKCLLYSIGELVEMWEAYLEEEDGKWVFDESGGFSASNLITNSMIEFSL